MKYALWDVPKLHCLFISTFSKNCQSHTKILRHIRTFEACHVMTVMRRRMDDPRTRSWTDLTGVTCAFVGSALRLFLRDVFFTSRVKQGDSADSDSADKLKNPLERKACLAGLTRSAFPRYLILGVCWCDRGFPSCFACSLVSMGESAFWWNGQRNGQQSYSHPSHLSLWVHMGSVHFSPLALQQGLSSSRPAAFHGDRKAIHSATGLVFYHVTSSRCKSFSLCVF